MPNNKRESFIQIEIENKYRQIKMIAELAEKIEGGQNENLKK